MFCQLTIFYYYIYGITIYPGVGLGRYIEILIYRDICEDDTCIDTFEKISKYIAQQNQTSVFLCLFNIWGLIYKVNKININIDVK